MVDILRSIFIVALLVISVYSADINQTIVSGNIKLYNRLLNSIKLDKNRDENRALQQILLYKLINLNKNSTVTPPSVTMPKDESSYRKLLHLMGELAIKRAEINKNIANVEKKLELVQAQLYKRDLNASDLLTLQLQYAFYKHGINIYKKQSKIYKDTINKATQYLIKAVQSIYFNSTEAEKRVKDTDEFLHKIDKAIQELDIEKERYNLLNKNDSIAYIDNQLANLNTQKREAINKKALDLFILYSSALFIKDSKRAFQRQKEIEELLDKYYPKEVQEATQKLFDDMDIAILGRLETIKGATIEEIKSAVSLFWEKANEPLFSINHTSISPLKLFLAILAFVAGIFVGGFYKKHIKKLTFRNRAFTVSTRTLVANLGYYFIVIVAFFISLHIVGIDLSSIALVAGALSVGIGFGLQNIVSNFVSGIILMFERSIKIGDYIEIDDNLSGHITDIRMRSTTITTNDNIDVIVPNQDFIQNRVVNWTMNDQIRRFRIPFGVAYGSNLHKVVGVIKEAVKNSGFNDIYSDAQRHTRVIMVGMNDSSVDFELFVWIKGSEIHHPRRTTSRFLILIYDALYEAGIEIPFPQRDIHIRSVDGDIPLKITDNNKG